MILLDYSSVAFPALYNMPPGPFNGQIFKTMIVNTIRMYNAKFKNEYGTMVVCKDSHLGSWRRDVFQFYKMRRVESRRADKETQKVDWKAIFASMDELYLSMKEYLTNWIFLESEKAEADDLIASIVLHNITTRKSTDGDDVMNDVFGSGSSCEKYVIISGDHDYYQLQQLDSGVVVRQYSPALKKWAAPKISDYIIDHTIRGCGGDDVPNILSPDDTFMTQGMRQEPIRKKLIDAILSGDERIEDLPYYSRNDLVINFLNIPTRIIDDVRGQVAAASQKNAMPPRVLPFLIKNRFSNLTHFATDFV